MAQDILVVGELIEGKPAGHTEQLLGAATRLAEGGTVNVTLLGNGATAAASSAFEAGADRAYVSDDAGYDEFRPDQWVTAVEAALDQADPAVILITQAIVGLDLGPRLAFRRDAAVATNCMRVEMEDGSLRVTRPCYAGNAQATFSFNVAPAIVTLRDKSQDPLAERRTGASGETVELPGSGETRVTIAGFEPSEVEGLQLQDASIVVSGGRGLGGPEGFQLVEELARAFGVERATTGASRAAVDLEWYPTDRQVGLTGKVVSPDLYVAVAISGASQHLAGCGGSKNIVAVNRDEEANIFTVARFGVVGDYKQVLPPLIEAVKNLD